MTYSWTNILFVVMVMTFQPFCSLAFISYRNLILTLKEF